MAARKTSNGAACAGISNGGTSTGTSNGEASQRLLMAQLLGGFPRSDFYRELPMDLVVPSCVGRGNWFGTELFFVRLSVPHPGCQPGVRRSVYPVDAGDFAKLPVDLKQLVKGGLPRECPLNK